MIPFGQPIITKADMKAVLSVLNSGWISMGEITKQFEKDMANYLGVNCAVATSSGSSALDLAFQVLEIKPDDEVILPAMTYIAPVASAVRARAKIVLADIDILTGTISPEDVDRKLTDKTKLIVAVDYAGIPANYNELKLIAQGIPILEDGAEALGGRMQDGRKLPSLGNIGILSFHSIKQVSCGEGGMLITNDGEMSDYARIIRNQGETGKKYHHVLVGNNFRMPEYVAALGKSQLSRIDFKVDRRKKLAQVYEAHFPAKMKLNYNHCEPCLFFFPVCVKEREKVMLALLRANIETRLAFEPVYLQPAYIPYLSIKDSSMSGEFPNTEHFWSQIIALPLHEGMSETDARMIADIILLHDR